MLRNQTPAPDFTLRDHQGQERSLSQLRGGKAIALFFFRGEFCPTSYKGLADYADIYPRFEALDADFAAISIDTPETLGELRETMRLPFTLLSDSDFKVSESYGVYRSDDEEGPQPHGEPAAFILDADGNIAYSQVQTGPKGSADPASLALVLLYMRDNGGRYR